MNHDHQHALTFASEQLDSVERAIGEFIKTKPYKLDDPSAHKSRVYGKILRPVPHLLRAGIGAVILTLRTSLDYLAFELVLANTNGKPKWPDRVEFPIFLARNKYKGPKGAIWKIGEASTAVQEEIERLQPYYGRNALKRRHPLWLIHELCNVHKHQQLTATGSIVGGVRVRNIDTLIKSYRIPGLGLRPCAFDDGALIAEIEGIPGYDMHVNIEAQFTVAFTKKGPSRGVPIMEGLRHLRDSLKDVVFPALEGFL